MSTQPSRQVPAASAGARPPAAPDPVESRREARLRVFRGEDPIAVIRFLDAATVPDAAAHVDRYRAERGACIRSRARADLIVSSILLLAVIGMWKWIRPMGVPPLLALCFLLGFVGLRFLISALLTALKAGQVPGDFSGLMPPDPELDPHVSWIERALKVGLSPLAGYGLIFLAVAVVIALGARMMNF